MVDRLPRKLAAILYADVAGYSRLTGEDEDATHRRLSEYLEVISTAVEAHRGQVMHYAGDAVLAMFDAVVDAVSCATEIQNSLGERNQELPAERKVEFRVGVNLGDVIEDRGDIYGDGVNVAARLESLADPGGICISDAVRTAVGKKLNLGYEDMGEQQVKNIEAPVRAYRVASREEPKTDEAVKRELALPDNPSIAVLPFNNMSGDPEQEYFSDGITEDIITALSRISALLVIARNSTMVYKGKAVDVKQVGREQGVRYVLEGSVRKAGNRVRVTAQLIDATTGHHLWADRYDRELDDVFKVQDEITRNITVEMRVRIAEGEQIRLWAGGTDSVQAWEYVARGTSVSLQDTREGDLEARRLAEAALSIDPGYVNATVLLGYSHLQEAFWLWGESKSQSMEQALECGHRALELDADHPDSRTLLAMCACIQGKHDEAILLAQEAVVLAPSHAGNTFWLGWILRNDGQYRKAVERMKRAMRLSPIFPPFYSGMLGSCYHLMGDNELAIQNLEEAVKREPDGLTYKPWLTSALIEAGQDEWKGVAEDVLRVDSEFSATRWAETFRFSRDQTVVERLLANLLEAGLPD